MRTHAGFIGVVSVVAAAGCHSSSSPSQAARPERDGGANGIDAGGLDATVGGLTPVDAASGGACAIAPPTLTDWRIQADGTVFRDSLGRAVLFRGVDAGGRSKFAPYVPFDFDDGGFSTALDSYMDRAASWGINAMRVPFTWAALEPVQGTDDESWLAMYDQLLAAAWARGIYTIVDFHQDVYAQVFCGDGFPGWTVPEAGPPDAAACGSWSFEYFNDPSVAAAFDTFWDAAAPVQPAYGSAWDVMVARYKDTPGVLGFEPINEPGWGTADQTTFETTTLTSFYGGMVTHMRGLAPSSLVFLDPPSVDGTTLTTTLGKPSGDGIVFAPHYYPLGGAGEDPAVGLKAWTTVGANWDVPTFIGEFGATDTDSATLAYMTNIFAGLDTLGLSGTEWEYSVSVENWNGETDTIVAGDGGELPVAQAVLRPFARATAGTGLTQAWDPTSRTFTASFTPTGGVSEISLPARAYPGGFEVAVIGACYDASTAGTIRLQPDGVSPTVSITVAPGAAGLADASLPLSP